MLIENYFVSREVAFILKDLGFNDRCIAAWVGDTLYYGLSESPVPIQSATYLLNTYYANADDTATAPFFHQAIDYLLFAEIYIEESVMLGGGHSVIVRGVSKVYNIFMGHHKYKLLKDALEYAYTKLDVSSIKCRFT
jgi:hypothetical protein